MDDVIQPGTADWHSARAGCWTASRAPALMSKLKNGAPSERAIDLITEIVAERLSGAPVDHFVTPAMQRGLVLEADALAEYAFRAGLVVDAATLVKHPSIERVAATPDGFVGDGLVEIKCPSSMSKHLAALFDAGTVTDGFAAKLNKSAPAAEYAEQCQWQMWVTGREWVDLVSYDPRFSGDYCLAVKRIEADETRHEEFAKAVTWAEGLVADALAGLKKDAAE